MLREFQSAAVSTGNIVGKMVRRPNLVSAAYSRFIAAISQAPLKFVRKAREKTVLGMGTLRIIGSFPIL